MIEKYVSNYSSSLLKTYASLRWKIIPVHNVSTQGFCSCGNEKCGSRGKHPRFNRWQTLATDDFRQIESWWAQAPRSNIGIVSGASSNLVIVDIDKRHGGEFSLAALIKENGPLPRTLKVTTGGGGFHIYFRHPGFGVRNRVNVRPGIDIRGDGGFIVAPPSVHASGQPYQWTEPPQMEFVAEVPSWLLEILSRNENRQSLDTSPNQVLSGSRNNFLAQKAGSLRRAGFDRESLILSLQQINNRVCKPPLSIDEVKKIAHSISMYPTREKKIEWIGQPKELPAVSAPVPCLSEKLIPSTLRPWVMDVSERMQVTPEFVMAPVIVALSSVVGRKVGIFPKEHDDWLVIPNLWGGIVARPGYFKSPTIAEALKPLDNLVAKAAKDFAEKKQAASSSSQVLTARLEVLKESLKKSARNHDEAELSSLQSEIEDLEGQLETLKVFEKRYKTNDATVEKVAQLLKENPNGLLIVRDELHGWMKSLDKPGREGDREFYLEAWNGYGSYTVDRVGSGTLHVPALSLSVLGGVQPGKLFVYVKDAIRGQKGDDGLLQRFQVLVYPDDKQGWENIDRAPDFKAREIVYDLFERLEELNMGEFGLTKDEAENSIPGVRFEPEAQSLFNHWRAKLEKQLRSDHFDCPALESHLAKYRSLMPSLSLLFWLLDFVTSRGRPKVSAGAAEMAVAWCEFLQEHARKIYSPTLGADVRCAHQLLKKVKSGAVRDNDTVRAIYRKQWATLDTTDKVDDALAVLEQYGWIKIDQEPCRGGASRKIFLHPSLQS